MEKDPNSSKIDGKWGSNKKTLIFFFIEFSNSADIVHQIKKIGHEKMELKSIKSSPS